MIEWQKPEIEESRGWLGGHELPACRARPGLIGTALSECQWERRSRASGIASSVGPALFGMVGKRQLSTPALEADLL